MAQEGHFIRLGHSSWGGLLRNPVEIGQEVLLRRSNGQLVNVRVVELLPMRKGLYCFRVVSCDQFDLTERVKFLEREVADLRKAVKMLSVWPSSWVTLAWRIYEDRCGL